jgi:GAF domain-containing protein
MFGDLARTAKVASSWSVPVLGPGGLLGVITVFRAMPGRPQRDDLDLAALYAGYAASAIERDRLLDQVTARNRVLETIREVLQTLAGPVPVAEALRIVLHALRAALDAEEVALVTAEPDGTPAVRAYSGGARIPPETLRAALAGWAGSAALAERVLRAAGVDPRARGESLDVAGFVSIAEAGASAAADPPGP